MEFPNFLSLFIVSFFMMLGSPILVDLSIYFNISPENMNFITTFYMIGEVSGFLIFNYCNRKFSKDNIAICVYILLISVLIGLILMTSLFFFYGLYFISGILLGIIFINSNSSMLESEVKNKDSVVNLGHGFFAIGALMSPFISSSLVDKQISWKIVYMIVIGLVLFSLISYFIKSKRKMTARDGLSKESEINDREKSYKKRNKFIYLLFSAILMLLYVMSEVTVFSWAPTFFRIDRIFDLYSASFIISLFWIGILSGRLLISYLSYKFKSGNLLITLSVISIVGLVILIFPTLQKLNFLGALITGLGFSGIPPLLISSTGKISGSGKNEALTVLLVTGITFGGLVPFIIRFIVNYSIFISILIAIIFMVAFAIFVIVRKYYRKTIKI